VREEAAAGRDAVTVLASNATRSTRKGKDWRVVLLRLGVVWGEEDAAPAAASAVVGRVLCCSMLWTGRGEAINRACGMEKGRADVSMRWSPWMCA
jgi:hypothetical protein